jgi:DNA invertase Pin-like site-specific DNA recombinase
MALIGYARVSTDKQDTRLQMQALQEAGIAGGRLRGDF